MTEPRHPIELEAPDISAWRVGNTGVEYVSTFDNGRAGPHVMVSAVVHGNELCRAIVLDYENCVLIMPSLRRRKGESAVRLGRFVD